MTREGRADTRCGCERQHPKLSSMVNRLIMKRTFSNIAFYGCALFLIMVTLVKPRYLEEHTNATLAWDVSGYYLYLPALFIYNDLSELKFLPAIIEKYTPSPAADQAYPADNGNMVMNYSAGMAVQYAPSFFLAHAVAKMTGYEADGFSRPYQAGIHWGSMLYAVIGLFFLRKILNRYFPDKTTGWVLVLIAVGTNFLNYATFDAANTHGYLFTLVAVLVWSTICFYDKFAWKYSLLIGGALGLLALTRPTELIYAAVPLFWGVSGIDSLRQRAEVLGGHFPKIVTAVLLAGAIGAIQLIYWKTVSGNWLEYSYQDQGFSFLRPHVADVFFSYRKGWLIYTPLMALALTGFWFLYKNHQKIFPLIFVFFLLNTWIICAWDIWWYGGAFGQRAFIQSYVLLAFPLGAFWETVHEKFTALPRLLTGLFVAACISLNIFQTYQAHWGPFETEAMNEAYYWRIFGKVDNDPADRLLLDTNEGYAGERKNAVLIKEEGFESGYDTTYLSHDFAQNGRWSSRINVNQAFSPGTNIPVSAAMRPGRWLHVEASFFSPKMIWDYWQMPQLVVRLEQSDVPVKERFIRPFRVMVPGEWTEVGLDIQLPGEDFDNVEIFLWNQMQADVELYMDDLRVTVFDAE